MSETLDLLNEDLKPTYSLTPGLCLVHAFTCDLCGSVIAGSPVAAAAHTQWHVSTRELLIKMVSVSEDQTAAIRSLLDNQRIMNDTLRVVVAR